MKSKQSGARTLAVVAALIAGASFAVAQQPAPSAPPAENAAASANGDAAASADAATAANADAETAATDAAVTSTPATAVTLAAASVAKSETMPNVTTQALILGIAETNSRAVAVGERGQILVSESRTDWRQIADVPTRATLTAVDAVGENVWAVGHDGTILHSGDGGLTWTVQRVDVMRPMGTADGGDTEEFNPRQGMPLLDVLMLDAQHGFAVGAYALMLRTDDGGATWTQVDVVAPPKDDIAAGDDEIDDEIDDASADDADAPANGDGTYNDDKWTINSDELVLDEETDPHFNGIVRTGSGGLFVVAERGAGFRSSDGGTTWQRIQLPYQGSMFGAIGYEADHLIAYGMRGNAFETTDLGSSWKDLDTGTELSLMGGAALPDGGAVFVGVNGIVVHRQSAADPFKSEVFSNAKAGTPVLASVLPRGGHDIVVSGEKGVSSFTLKQ